MFGFTVNVFANGGCTMTRKKRRIFYRYPMLTGLYLHFYWTRGIQWTILNTNVELANTSSICKVKFFAIQCTAQSYFKLWLVHEASSYN